MMNKTIPVFDEAGNYIKDVFPRYAIQRVLKGQAIWIKRSSAIQVLKLCPILSVFPSIGVSFSVRDAMNKLIALSQMIHMRVTKPPVPLAGHRTTDAFPWTTTVYGLE